MSKQNRQLNQPERLVVYELTDVVDRHHPDKPNLYVTTTRIGKADSKRLEQQQKKSRRRLASAIVTIREDLSPEGWYQDSKSRGSAKSEYCKKLALEGYCVNPNPETKYSIYVVKLARSAWLKDSRQPIYVGESSYEPVERIAQHLQGVRAARKVKNHFESRWEALEPDGKIFHSYYDAIAAETNWGLKLLSEGYKVFGPQGLPTNREKA